MSVSAAEVVRSAGITYRQLDHWTRLGLLRAVDPTPGSGYAREYGHDQIRLASTLSRLREAGLTLPTAHRAALAIIADGHARLNGFTIAPEEA